MVRKFLFLLLLIAQPVFADEPAICRTTLVNVTATPVTTRIFEFHDHPMGLEALVSVITPGTGTASIAINGYGPETGIPAERATYTLCGPISTAVSRCTNPDASHVEAVSATVSGCTNCSVRVFFCGSQP